MELILAIDQGTTGSTVSIVDTDLNIHAQHDVDFKQIFPKPGWVEHNPDHIWQSVTLAMRGALAKLKRKSPNIVGIGITNQRETSCFWNRKTGEPLSNAIVWQDRRTTDLCDELRKKGLEPQISKSTGLLIDPYFSASKILWSLKHNPNVSRAAKRGELAFGTIDSYLVHRLTGGRVHITEPSNASRTMLFDLRSNEWNRDLCRIFQISVDSLPLVVNSFSESFGKTYGVKELPNGIPITGVLGDQQSALLGQACVKSGQAKCTFGTGSFILMNTGPRIVRSKHRLLTTVAWRWNDVSTYALEGGAFTAGAAVQWVRDGLELIPNSPAIEALARTVDTTDGVIFVPAFTGIGAPYWDPEARAGMLGCTRGTTKAHVARAVLEGIAHMNVEILEAMKKDSKLPLRSLNVDGGASQNTLLMQMQADALNCSLVRPKIIETTSLGAVFAAGLGAGVWRDFSAIEKAWKKDCVFQPRIKSLDRKKSELRWKRAVKAVRLFGS